MKRLLHPMLVLVGFSFLLMSSSCDEPESDTPETEEYTLSASPTSISFTAEGGTDTIAVTSNTTWSVEYTSSWCRPSLQTIKGDANVKITADENDSTEVRTATFTITADSVDDVTISITQEAAEADTSATENLPDWIASDNTNMRDLTSIELSALMGIGWNIGNSLESISTSGDTYTGSETSWGNPKVTRTLIDSVKEAGFNTVRIPVSWSNHLTDEGTYEIDADWLARVEEVVNYCLDNEMYAIINIHWDGGWMDEPTYEMQDSINNKITALWKQIAKYFRDYNDYLLFAGTNEVMYEDDYSDPTEEYYTVQNSFNQTFINAVRATGGRNTYRHLIVQAFNTNISYAVSYFTTPTDSTEDRMMLEVHFYDPYSFTLQESGSYVTQWGTGYTDVSSWGQEDWVDEAFGYMKTNFIDNGMPVIMGEYGAILRTSLTDEAYALHVSARNYYLNYVTSKALEDGMVPVYWDNGDDGDGGFALFDRSTGAVVYPDALNAIISSSEE